jgi:hypothetical protein
VREGGARQVFDNKTMGSIHAEAIDFAAKTDP